MINYIFNFLRIHQDIQRPEDCIIRIQGLDSSSTATTQKEIWFSPTEHKCNEEIERGLGEWRWMNVWYHCMNVIRNACIEKDKKKKLKKKKKKKETLLSRIQRRIWICAELISLIRRLRVDRDTAELCSEWSLEFESYSNAKANYWVVALLKHKINKNQL